MPTGKLSAIKTYGEKPVFSLESDIGVCIIPDLDRWLFEHIGKTMTIGVTERSWAIFEGNKE